MELNLFLWPMLLPMVIPIFYCLKFKRESLVKIGMLTTVMILIVILYWPLLTTNFLGNYTYTSVKFFLFVLLPILGLQIVKSNKNALDLNRYGLKLQGLKKSTWLFVLFLPIMLGVTIAIQLINGVKIDFNLSFGTIMFFEAFSEEFFFRGILFIFLLSKTNLQVAYITSLASFVLMHPQNLTTVFIFGTIIQGILTIEICRRSDNLIGAWLLHGTNRFFTIAIIPLLFLS